LDDLEEELSITNSQKSKKAKKKEKKRAAEEQVKSTGEQTKSSPGMEEVDISEEWQEEEKKGEDGNLPSILVGNPKWVGERVSGHYVYPIKTKANECDKEYSTEVHRRFNDLVRFHENLVREFPGHIIPPIPDKSALSKITANEEFLNSRRMGIENFLKKLLAHAVLGKGHLVRNFVLQSDHSFAASQQLEETSTGTQQLVSFFSSLGSSIATTVSTAVNGAYTRRKTEMDHIFEDYEKYFNVLSERLTELHKQAEMMIDRMGKSSRGMFEISLAFSLLARNEADPVAALIKKVGDVSEQISHSILEEATSQGEFFESPLQEYLRTVIAVKEALTRRGIALEDVARAEYELQQKKVQVAKKAHQLNNNDEYEIKILEDKVHELEHRLSTMSKTLRDEIENFKVKNGEELKTIVSDFIKLQVAYAEKLQKLWDSDNLKELRE